MAPRYRQGDKVNYKAVGGPDSNTSVTKGVIKSWRTNPGPQAGLNVKASEDQPRYEIENFSTGKTHTIYEKNILGLADD